MGSRLQLQADLEALLGTRHVYNQPPTNVQMEYPCIVYKRDTTDTVYADNSPYKSYKRYTVTVIDRHPDSLIPDKVAKLPYCSHTRYYVANQLHHDSFDLYY